MQMQTDNERCQEIDSSSPAAMRPGGVKREEVHGISFSVFGLGNFHLGPSGSHRAQAGFAGIHRAQSRGTPLFLAFQFAEFQWEVLRCAESHCRREDGMTQGAWHL